MKKYEIGARIRKYREKKGLSQTELAQMLNIKNSRVSNWEQGLNRPDADILAKLCYLLDVPPSELLGVQLMDGELSEQERKVIAAYRSRPELQQAVNILLGITD